MHGPNRYLVSKIAKMSLDCQTVAKCLKYDALYVYVMHHQTLVVCIYVTVIISGFRQFFCGF